MATAHDVANYILEKLGRMTAMKLQKLVYYSQAWSLVWDEKPLFRERIEAWVNGPVVPNLYRVHRGQFDVKDWPHGDPDNLNALQCETVDIVLDFYGDKSSQWLSELTHSEQPWKDARQGLAPTDRGGNEITHASMHEYYSSIPRL
jgi:uncharacterized phage-associated protein